MKIVFRLNYHTIPGQSLWLKYSTVLDEKGVRFDQVVPLHWINDGQWETSVNVRGAGRFRMEYNYQLRQVERRGAGRVARAADRARWISTRTTPCCC